MACVAPDLASVGDDKPRESTLLKGFGKAITAMTVCHTGGNQVGSNHSVSSNHSSVEGLFACGTSRRLSTKDLAKAADDEAQKVLNLLAERMTVSKAIMDDVEVLSMLVERLFS